MQTQTTEQPKYAQKTLDAIQLVSAGLDPTKALQAVNYKTNITAQAVNKFKKKFQKYSLTQPKVVKLAHKAILDTLNGETSEYTAQKVTKDGDVVEYQEVIAPSVTNKLAAAAMVYDRVEPVKREAEGNPEGNTYLDLSTINVQINCQSPVDNLVDKISTCNTSVIDVSKET